MEWGEWNPSYSDVPHLQHSAYVQKSEKPAKPKGQSRSHSLLRGHFALAFLGRFVKFFHATKLIPQAISKQVKWPSAFAGGSLNNSSQNWWKRDFFYWVGLLQPSHWILLTPYLAPLHYILVHTLCLSPLLATLLFPASSGSQTLASESSGGLV